MKEGASTFAIDDDTAHLLGTAADMRAASRALPEGAYTTLRTYEGRRLLRLGQHLRRLEESAALQGHPAQVDEPAVRRGLRQVLGKAAGGELRLRLTFAPPRFFVSVEAFVPLPPAAYEAGVDCVTVAVRRENPHAKDTRFIATAGQAYAELPAGVEEGLMLAADGSVLEGLSSNFFAVTDGVLRTEGDRVLAGVTRAIVLEVAKGVLPVALRPVTRDELGNLAECFITSVSREVVGVVRIDGRPVGDARPGPTTRLVVSRFAQLVAAEAKEP